MARKLDAKKEEEFCKKLINENYCRFLGKIYQTTKKMMEQECSPEIIREMENNREYDEILVDEIDQVLQEFSEEMQLIIRKEFLENSPEGWYEELYKKRKYLRLKEKAVEQFSDCFTPR